MKPAKAAKPCVTPSWQLNPQKPLFHNISRCRYALLLGQCGSDGGKPVGAAVGDGRTCRRSVMVKEGNAGFEIPADMRALAEKSVEQGQAGI